MAEQQKPPPRRQPPPAEGGNPLTRHYGPLPGWGWLAVAVVGYLLYKKFSGSSTSGSTLLGGGTSGAATGPSAGTLTISTPGGGSISGSTPGVLSALGQLGGGIGGNPSGAQVGANVPGTLPSGTAPSGVSVVGSPTPGGQTIGVQTAPGQGGPSPGNIGGAFGALAAPVGSTPAAAQQYELGSITGPGGAQYNVYDFGNVSQQQQAAALYGANAGAGQGFVQQGQYTPTSGFYQGQTLTVIPNAPNQPAPAGFGY